MMYAGKTVVAFDVDGTLLGTAYPEVALESMRSLLIEMSHLGCYIVVWSGSGKDYAERRAREIHITHWVDRFASKTEATAIQADITFDDEKITLGTVNIRIP